MSRHLEILRKARADGELFTRGALVRSPAPVKRLTRRAPSRDHWQQLVHELFLREAGSGKRALGFASATPGEGTSYVTAHVAAELARTSERDTLLLELNLCRPSQAGRHGVEPDPGLRRLLVDREFPVEACLRPTVVEHLWLLPAGSASNGLGAGPDWTHFPRLLERLRARFGALVADLPPVNLSTDTLIVGGLLDGLVLVVEADLCSREVIGNAVERLRRANPNVLGSVLNKRKFVIPEAIYRRL